MSRFSLQKSATASGGGIQIVSANAARATTGTRLDHVNSQMVNISLEVQGQGLNGINTASQPASQRNQASAQNQASGLVFR